MDLQLSVLLVEDNDTTNFLHNRVLRRSGSVAHIEICTDGAAALRYLNTPPDTPGYHHPDLILLDINMPGLSGWGFLEAFRDLPRERRQATVIVMLTTSLNPDDAARAAEIPEVADFMDKPLNKDQFRQLVERYFVVG